MESRVVPGTADTIVRSSPRSAFNRELLPTFGPAHYGYVHVPGRLGSVPCRHLYRRQCFYDRVEEVADAESVLRRDAVRRAQAKFPELVLPGGSLSAIDLVHGQDNGYRASAKDLGDLMFLRAHPTPAVDDEDHDGRERYGLACLVTHLVRQWLLRRQVYTPGVDHDEPSVQPLRRTLLSIARHPRRRRNHGFARAGEAVEQRRLAHIGVTDHGDARKSA